MEITQPDTAALETLVDLWVALATDQRQYGSRLCPNQNRQMIADTIGQHIVTGGLLVARDATDIHGFVMFHVRDGRYVQDESTGVIAELYVRPAARDDDIGSKLLAAAEAELASEGVDSVSLEVLAANDDARRLYRRHEYRPHRVELAKSMENDTHSKGED